MRREDMKKIREYISEKEGVKKVIITKQNRVESWGKMPRGDGGKLPWRRFEGDADEILLIINYNFNSVGSWE